MYKQKSEIIEQIQSYHNQLANLYLDIYEKVEDVEIKSILHDLYQHEESRYAYLDKHLKVAKLMNCWLDVPYSRLSEQISECFKNLKTGPVITINDIIKIEIHFDNCLIKLYNILAAENELSESLTNIFYYMLKKTTEEEILLSKMFQNSNNKVTNISELKNFSQLNYTTN